MSRATRERVRALSETLFGQRYRLEAMVAIALSPDGLVCQGDLARALAITPSNLQRPISDLTTSNLISKLPYGDSRRRFYRRNDSLAWEFALELLASAEATPDQLIATDLEEASGHP